MGGGIDWPSHSPDLNVCDFFLWGYLKDRVYKTNPQTIEELKERITEEIRSIPIDVRHASIEAFEKRLQLVVASNGSHFENLLH